MSKHPHNRNSRDELEHILDGLDPSDSPLSRLLAAARGPARSSEIEGLDAALASFATAADAATPADARPVRRRLSIFTAFAAAGLTTQIAFGVGIALAAGMTGIIVTSVVPHHHRAPSAPVTSAASSPSSASSATSPGASGSHTASAGAHVPSPTSTSLPSTTNTLHPVGPVNPTPLCASDAPRTSMAPRTPVAARPSVASRPSVAPRSFGVPRTSLAPHPSDASCASG